MAIREPHVSIGHRHQPLKSSQLPVPLRHVAIRWRHQPINCPHRTIRFRHLSREWLHSGLKISTVTAGDSRPRFAFPRRRRLTSQDSRTYLFGAFVSTRRIAPCTRPMRIPICCNRRNEGVPRYIEGENALAASLRSTRGVRMICAAGWLSIRRPAGNSLRDVFPDRDGPTLRLATRDALAASCWSLEGREGGQLGNRSLDYPITR